MLQKQFREFRDKYNFVGFGGYMLKTYTHESTGELKKTLGIATRQWATVITKENMEDYLKNSDKSFYILTGQKHDTVLIDFDTTMAYENFVAVFPECKTYLTQKTRKGYHLVMKYHAAFDTSCTNDEHEKEECKIDFKSNGGCLVELYGTCTYYPFIF